MLDRDGFEGFFANLRNVSVDIVRDMRSGEFYESSCIMLDGIHLAWATWKAAKKDPA